MVRHALAAEDKEIRRNDILVAALSLFLRDTRRLPSVAAVAETAGLAKGTVYLYFDSKEEIFIALLSREWHGLLDLIENAFTDVADTRERLIARFIGKYVGYLHAHPYFLRLDSLGYALLEASLTPEGLWDFKRHFSSYLERAGSTVDSALTLTPGRGLAVLTRVYALTRGLWQLTDYPDYVKTDPQFSEHPFARIDFQSDLQQALTEYWRGAV